MAGFIYIRNAEDDAYVNHGRNFRGMEQAASATVILYFESPISSAGLPAAYDKITLAVTANKEKEAMIDINGALAGGKAGSTTILADEYAGGGSIIACSDAITAVTTIAKAQSGTAQKLVDWNQAKTLTAGDSGAWIYASDATAGILTLPANAAGLNFEIFIQKSQTGDTHILAASGEFFEGGLQMGEADTATENLRFDVANTAEDDAINLDSDAKGRLAGGYIKLVSDGTKWHATGVLNGTGSIATPWHTAES